MIPQNLVRNGGSVETMGGRSRHTFQHNRSHRPQTTYLQLVTISPRNANLSPLSRGARGVQKVHISSCHPMYGLTHSVCPKRSIHATP
ncbi:hypothetical protein [Blackfly microvirus SF02]|uniref:Uncharacterized protein n=1 Tax=Blackfly microvirus SF02 TaxID=2576452 RepID=A0A4P8PLA9_9VIRU|nr:hypothetical protein [Blackfly microvirus SF02]